MQIVTLTTDFGDKDYYVAMLKGSILKHVQNIQLIDISHSISSHDLVQGAFFVKNVYDQFPEGTIHVIAVQSYFAQSDEFMAFEYEGYQFIGPNNGLFSLIFDEFDSIQAYRLRLGEGSSFLHQTIAHGVGYLSHGLPISELGEEIEEKQQKLGLKPVTTTSNIRATVIHIDHFGNVIVNLTKTLFEKMRKGRSYKIYYKSKDPIERISNCYSDVEIGDVLCHFNSAGYMEIAVFMGNADEMLGLKKNETIQIDFLN